jgi:hypothetical protein
MADLMPDTARLGMGRRDLVRRAWWPAVLVELTVRRYPRPAHGLSMGARRI